VVRALPKVYRHRRRIRREIIRNKRPPNYNRCRFIKAVRFVFEFTSYINIFLPYGPKLTNFK
jgi:hypothetical protein